MKHFWIKAEVFKWTMVCRGELESRYWTINKSGIYTIKDKYFLGSKTGFKGRLTEEQKSNLEKMLPEVKKWLPVMNSPEFLETQQTYDGEVWSLKVTENETTIQYFDHIYIYIYEFPVLRKFLHYISDLPDKNNQSSEQEVID